MHNSDFRPGDVLWRVGMAIPEVGVDRLQRYEVEDFDPDDPLGLRLVGIPGRWSSRGWMLLSRRLAH